MKKFTSFAEASTYAKEVALRTGASVKLERDGDQWMVLDSAGLQGTPISFSNSLASPDVLYSDQTRNYDNWLPSRKRFDTSFGNAEDIERKARDIEDKKRAIRKADDLDRKERQPFLDSRKKHYQGLSDQELEELWFKRSKLKIEEDELLILRNVIRERKGISTAPDAKNTLVVCSHCLSPKDSCTCGRGWW